MHFSALILNETGKIDSAFTVSTYFESLFKKNLCFFFYQTRSLWLELLWGSGGEWREEERVPSPRTVQRRGEAAQTLVVSHHRGRKAVWSSMGARLDRAYDTMEPRPDSWEVSNTI